MVYTFELSLLATNIRKDNAKTNSTILGKVL